MSLSSGARLGSYEILTLIGAGGMGEVYRARDAKLGRDVAIKVLPDLVAGDPDRLARFHREAQVLASLNHPNIAHIHGYEESNGIHALVMELVEGATLADWIAHGPIPIDQALATAKQIAEALDAAHEQGVIHRDLKPANIKVRDDGIVKVLDFGLAKLADPGGTGAAAMNTNSPTLSLQATRAGVILGTAAYMAPEQARGKSVDKRADIWAFGCVLFEMLTGAPPFGGEDVAEVIGAVIHKEPIWDTLPPNVPVAIRATIHRCLQKDPKQRLRDIGDVQLALSGAFESPTPAVAAPSSRAPVGQRVLAWAVAGTLGVALAATLALWAPWRRPARPAPQRLTVALGADVSLANTTLGASAILSPDGQTLAFVAQSGSGPSQLYVRRLDQLKAMRLSGTDDASSPFFSPDGRWIAFFAGSQLKKISVTGGAAVTLCPVTGNASDVRGGVFADADTIVVAPTGPGNERLLRVPSAGGTPEPLLTLAEGEATQRWPQVLPGGKAVLFTSHTSSGGISFDDASIVVQALPTGPRRVLQRGGYYGHYLPSGHLVYVHEGTLFAAPFDLDRLEVVGQRVPVIDGVTTNAITAGAQFAASETGTLVYLPRTAGIEAPIAWLDRSGPPTPLRTTAADWTGPAFSADGRRLAVNIAAGGSVDVWVYEWARDALTRLTSGATTNSWPVWTPDDRRITYESTRDSTAGNLYWQRADGAGGVQRLTESKSSQLPVSWHPSGKFLAFTELTPQSGLDLMILPMEGDETSGWKPGKPTTFLSTPASEMEPMFSPDGRWIAYRSNESGRFEVYVRPFPGPGGAQLISTGGGIGPVWSRSRHELFYEMNDQHIMVVPYSVAGESFRADKPRRWTDTRVMLRGGIRSIDLHPDGERFAVATIPVEQSSDRRDEVVFVLNFFDDLRRLVPPTTR